MKAMLIIRCSVGAIFLSEGIQKFLYPLFSRRLGSCWKIRIPFITHINPIEYPPVLPHPL
jgi:hypothetical protein